MSETFRRRPGRGEYADYYAGYIALVPDGDVVEVLRSQGDETAELFASIPAERWDYRYAPGKWTTREVIGHLIDTEWVFVYRALRFARGDGTPLPGMDQDEFMAGANFGARPLPGMADEYRHLRGAGTALFASFDEGILDRSGDASGCRFTVRALLYVIAGHERHHLDFLKERYL